MQKSDGVWLVLFLLLGYFELLLCKVHYIIPSESHPCIAVSCLTLSQFAQNTTLYLDSNTTLIFTEGRHILHRELSVSNIQQFSMLSTNDTSVNINITCSESASLSFTNIGYVHIYNLAFVSCGSCGFSMVHQLNIEHSTFLNSSGTSIKVNGTNASVTETFFVSNTRGVLKSSRDLIFFRHLQVISTLAYTQSLFVVTVGGAITTSYSTIAINNCMFEGNSANVGGAIFSEHGSNITINNSQFFSNHATGSSCTYQFCTGGAFLIDGSGTVIVHNSTFKNNTSDQDGGMAALFNTSLLISHSIVCNNTAARYGGAIATVSSSLRIDNSQFEYNSAGTGGGVVSSLESNATIINSTYSYNSVQTNGSVIYTQSNCNIVIENCTFINNSATDSGGVLYIETESMVAVSDSIIHNNTANFGGYIFASDVASISVNGSTFTNNVGETRGGVIYLMKNSSTLINGSTFTHNKADLGGGVISVEEFGSSAVITACNFSDNVANDYGGVAHITDGGGILVNDSIFSNNMGDSGGVFDGYSMSNITVYRSNFTHNRAKTDGGAVSMRQGGNLFVMNCIFHNHSSVELGAVIHAFQGTDTTIRDCYFSQNSALFGGVLTMISYNNMTIDNSVFFSNTAKIDGGVFYLRTWCRIVIKNNCLFNNNTANHDGIVITTYNSFVMIESTTFSDNVAGHDGGCLYMNENSAVVLNGSNLTRNYASNSGGVVFGLKSSKITVTTSRIDGNAAQNSGGVIHAQQDSNIMIIASNFTNNTAEYGGVLRIYVHSIANITGSTFAGNMAKVGGGVMAVYESSILSVYTSDINHNKAPSGGVIYAFQNTFEDNRSTTTPINIVLVIKCMLWNNTGNYGGILNTEGSRVVLKSTFVHQNRAVYIGGGIYASSLSTININASNFTSNRAEDNAGVIALIGGSAVNVNSSFFTGNVATNRGGVVYLYQSNASILNGTFISSLAGQNGGVVHALLHSKIRIDNSSLINNTASKLGGAVSSLLGVNLIIQNCKFIKNSASSSGGALHITDNSNATIVNSIFQLNRAQDHGGAIAVSNLSDVIVTGGSSLSQNTAQNGAALAVEETSRVLFYTSPLTSNNSTEKQTMTSGEIIIHNNTAIMSGGGIYLKNSFFCLGIETNISYNQGSMISGGIHAANSSTDIGSVVQFDSNRAMFGGAISLTDSELSQFSDQNVAFDINFVSNIAAKYGGAIYVDDEQDTVLCSSGLDDPYLIKSECFFQNVTNGLTFNFNNNYAKLRGYDLFGGLLDRCTVASDMNVSRLKSYGTAHFANISNISQNFETVSSEPVRVCHCINNKPSCGHKLPPIQVKNGNNIIVSVAAVDQVNHIVASTVYSRFLNLSSSNGQTVHKLDAQCSHLIYRMSFSEAPKEYELLLYADGPCRDKGISKLSIDVHVLSCLCPHGFMRSNDNSACVCVCDKRDEIFTTFIQECNSISESVIRKGRFWITYFNDSDNSSSPYFIYPYCPLDYCQPLTNPTPVNLNQPNGSDAQCANNRSGLLCGRCKPAYSLSLGSSSCIICDKNWYGLFVGIIIAAFIAGIILVILLLMLNITVAIGSLNSIIFYANIIYANRSIYFSVSHSEPVKTFISWLNLEIGIDTCFYNGMDTYAKTWIQLVFPIYMIFLVVVVIWISSCSIKLSNLMGRRNPVATLATLILISYTKLLETVIASLSFVPLRYPNGTKVTKWVPDASVEYGKGKHVALICVAIVILVAGLLYTIIIFSWQWLLPCQKSVLLKWTRNLKFHSFVSTYHTPHTAKHRYWTGMLLLVRVIVYLISAFSASVDPRIALLATVIIISCLLVYKAMFLIRAYKNWVLNALESYVYVNIVIITSIALYTFDDRNKETLQTICAYISAGTVFILFLLVITYHVYRFSSTKLYSSSQKSELGRKVNTLLSNNQDINHQISLESSILDAIDASRDKFSYKPDLQLNSGPTSSTVSMEDCAESPTVECSPQHTKSGDKTSLSLQQRDDNDSEQNKRSASITDSGIISKSCSIVEAERTMSRKSKPKLLKFGSLRKSNKGITEPLLEENNL